MQIRDLIPKLCRQLLNDNEDWVGGVNQGQKYPKTSCLSDFLFSLVSELKARGMTREEIENRSTLAHAKELCTPTSGRSGYIAKSIDREKKATQLTNIIASHLDELFPESILLLNHSEVKSKFQSLSQATTAAPAQKHDIINHEILDESISREERYAAYLKKLDEESSEGKPIYNFNENYGVKELLKDHPDLAPDKKKGEDSHE